MGISTLKSFDTRSTDAATEIAHAEVIEKQVKILMEACNNFIKNNDKNITSSFLINGVSRKWSEDAMIRSRGECDSTVLAARAKRLYQERRVREQFFLSEDIFGEPAWDILLDLMITHCLGKQISITSACIASSVPPTTALRWITALEECGFISRTSDENDRRRAFVKLTRNAIAMMSQYLEKIGD